MAHWLKSCSWIFFSPLPSLCDCWCHSRAILRECCWNVSVKRLARSHYSKLFKLGLRKGLIFIQSTEKEWVCWGRCREIVPVETWKEKLIFPLIQPLETMETLMEGGMAVFRNGGVACRSTITFHSGSLRDGIHYTVARETDRNRGEKKTHTEIGRHRQRGEKKKRKCHLAVKVITGGNLHAPVLEWSRCSVLSFVFFPLWKFLKAPSLSLSFHLTALCPSHCVHQTVGEKTLEQCWKSHTRYTYAHTSICTVFSLCRHNGVKELLLTVLSTVGD